MVGTPWLRGCSVSFNPWDGRLSSMFPVFPAGPAMSYSQGRQAVLPPEDRTEKVGRARNSS